MTKAINALQIIVMILAILLFSSVWDSDTVTDTQEHNQCLLSVSSPDKKYMHTVLEVY